MCKYIMPKDVVVKINGNDLELQRGVLNFHELIIDIKESNPKLIKVLRDLNKREVYRNVDPSLTKDLDLLSKYGYLNALYEYVKPEEVLIAVTNSEIDLYDSSNLKTNVISCAALISDSSVSSILNIQDSVERKVKLQKIVDDNSLKKFKHIFWVDSYYDARRIRVFNLLLKFLGIKGTFVISDVNFFFITTVKHGYTGCFECLENQIKTRISNIEILQNPYNRNEDIPYSTKILKLGYVSLILEEIVNDGVSNSMGNVFEFDTETKETFFDSNRIQSSCQVCATQNNAFHEEETIKTVNILNGFIQKDGEK